ncbi:MAG: tripartite tricarboxylate transporter permease [Spirochaetales bacterium]|nr:tripartite tricarboxylate transporter permease [Spirochaetales bacterium]
MDAFLSVFSFNIIIPWILAMFLGIFVGGIPGLTATMAVALIVPLTFHMTPIAGLAMIIGVSFTSIFAGDIPATFLRIPGTPASGAAVLDGYEMTKQGRGYLAIYLDLACSAIGGVVGILILIFVSPVLAGFALKFTHFEYFWLGVLGLSMSAVISRTSKIKGVISIAIGVLISTIGIDLTTGFPRFAYGKAVLMGGIGFIPVMIGLFGVSEVLRSILSTRDLSVSAVLERTRVSLKEVFGHVGRHIRLVLQSSVVGTVIGALPGAGADVAAWVAYGTAKRTSRKPDEFGKGSVEGVIAPTSANNAALGGSWVPALVFGIPGDTITAIVLGAMLMYGLKPGPLIFETNRFLVDQIFSVGLVSQLFLVIIGFLGIRAYSQVFKFPRNVVYAGILIFSMVGAFAMRSNLFDVWLVIIFGVIGFVMEKAKIPLVPLILGIILGPMIESNLRIGLIKTTGRFLPFISRPISIVLVLILAALFLWEPLAGLIKSLRQKRGRN